MSNEYIVLSNKLVINNSEIIFDFPIDYCTEVNEMLIVLLSIPVDKEYNENVFGINIFESKIKWQVSKQQYNPVYRQKCPFISVIFNDGILRLNNWCGLFLIVDPLTGQVLKTGETR